MKDAAGPKALLELRVFRVVWVLRLFFGIEVIQVAEELVEAVYCRQELIPITEMVLAKLAGSGNRAA